MAERGSREGVFDGTRIEKKIRTRRPARSTKEVHRSWAGWRTEHELSRLKGPVRTLMKAGWVTLSFSMRSKALISHHNQSRASP